MCSSHNMSAQTALGIPLILEKVVRNLSRKDLYSCRLVQSLWNTEACKILQHEQVLLHSFATLRLFNDTFQSSIHGISMIPSSFYLDLDNLVVGVSNDDMALHEKEMEKFVQIARYHVKELEIWVHIGESDCDLVVLLQILICHCFPNLNRVVLHVGCARIEERDSQNVIMFKSRLDACESNCVASLKELKINVNSTSHLSGFRNQFVSFASELSSNAVNLQYICLQFNSSNSDVERRLEECVVKAIVPKLCQNVKQITICPERTSRECVCALTQHATLALHDIRLNFMDTSAVTNSDLKRLFNRYRNTLQVLELDFLEPSQRSLPLGVPLNKLRWLSVENFEGIIEWDKLPAIEHAELVYCSVEEIISLVLTYPLNESTQDVLNIQWNSKPQNVFIAKLAEDEPYQLPDPSIVTILKGNKKLISFHNKKSRIRYLINTTNISGKYLQALSSHPIHFPIQKFGIVFDTDFVAPSEFQQFLNRYHASLQKLELEFKTPLDVCFPAGNPMKKLADLTLKNFQGSLQWSQLPNLKHVKLDSQSLCAIVPSIVDNPDDCKIHSIECFRGTEQDDDLYITIFAELALCLLPKLTTLVIGQDCIAPLSAILCSCMHLKRLELIRCRGVTDELLCGTGTVCPPVILLDERELDDDDDDENDICEDDFLLYSQYRTIVKEMRFCSYIGDLKELEHLEMVFSDENAFSDISILCGIIDCDKLETLTLQSPNISYETSRRVLQKAKLQHLLGADVNDYWINLEPEE